MRGSPPFGSSDRRGAGLLLRTEVDHVDLGTHAGRLLRARVEHRTLRLALGRRWSGGLTLGRRRPVAVEVRPDPAGGAAAGARYDVAIDAPPDPWPRALRRTVAVALLCWATVRIASRLRRRGERKGTVR